MIKINLKPNEEISHIEYDDYNNPQFIIKKKDRLDRHIEYIKYKNKLPRKEGKFARLIRKQKET